jgi:GT2 family glycosyltransferase
MTLAEPPAAARAVIPQLARPVARGKFIWTGAEKLYVRGVTYGTFALDDRDHETYDPQLVEQDFRAMAAAGMNAVRLYTVPPRWLLDLAHQHRLRVMVGLPWQQHIAFLDDRRARRDIERRVREGVRACAGHPAVLWYAIGNEIPASIVRWHGARRVERFLHRLYRVAKREDPDALVTYVNFPSTEYLDLPFIDLVCFNVYLESEERLESYLARLQNIAGERPLVMTETGLDSKRHGLDAQATSLAWQIRTAFTSGCAGVFTFGWTDEWHRGGYEIDDWDFGLTDRQRLPKPALAAVSNAYTEVPFPADVHWPSISVVVCSFNGQRTIADCMEGLIELDYPNVEVIVVNDGSTDATPLIASEYGFRVITTENRGLSNARNTGMQAASGEIVAYTDDDARPDPHWLKYLAWAFIRTTHAGVGGPNIAPPGDGPIAECVANAPGGPLHVLVTDTVAEHIPGCNMAFRRSALLAVEGCDPQYRAAGDDVDLCWRIQDAGGTIGFHAGAMVWHHRRNSFRMYWKQQQGYGKAEALLEAKWPERYNAAGHTTWAGRIYGRGLTRALGRRIGRVYQGGAGSALFQSVYQPANSVLSSLPLMPEWYFAVLALGVLTCLGPLWAPLFLAALPLGATVAAPLVQAAISARAATFPTQGRSRLTLLRLHTLTAIMHAAQPLARLRGRIRWGLTPWRGRGRRGLTFPAPRTITVWSERWTAPEDRLTATGKELQSLRAPVTFGAGYERWDVECRGGLFGSARGRLAVEEHSARRQLVRVRLWPRYSLFGLGALLVITGLTAGAAISGALIAAVVLGATATLLVARALFETSSAMASILHAVRASQAGMPS